MLPPAISTTSDPDFQEGGVFYKRVNKVFSTFVDEFSKQLTKSQCAIAVTIVWIAYIVFSVWVRKRQTCHKQKLDEVLR